MPNLRFASSMLQKECRLIQNIPTKECFCWGDVHSIEMDPKITNYSQTNSNARQQTNIAMENAPFEDAFPTKKR